VKVTTMRSLWLALAGSLALAGCDKGATGGKAPGTDEEKTLYVLGFSMGQQLKTLDLTPAEVEMVKAGLSDAAAGKTAQAEPEVYGPKIRDFANQRQGTQSEKEKQKGKDYAEKAGKQQGAATWENGLVVIPEKEGEGSSPSATDTVRVHYRGTLIDGTEFDSSYSRNQPAEFPLNGVIPCWTQGLQKMKTGGKAKLVCPADIAYGDRGRPPKIPGGATLVFEVELLEIKGAAAPPEGHGPDDGHDH
jgi:FKBP-type peptidyl-prolyl cis-trans isomerase FkpA